MNVLNDPRKQCCKENGVPVKCIGMCSGHLNDDNDVGWHSKQGNRKKLNKIRSCKKHWNAIRICQNLTKGTILIFFTFLSEIDFTSYYLSTEQFEFIPHSARIQKRRRTMWKLFSCLVSRFL